MRKTIWRALADKLGREPTNKEAKEEVLRILSDVTRERAEQGKLQHQKRST